MQDRMRVAADLIREHRYEEARMLLRTVDHPQAREWEQKIEGRLGSAQVPDPPLSAFERTPAVKRPRSFGRHRIRNAVITVLVILVILGAGYYLVFIAPAVQRMRAQVRLYIYCTDIYAETRDTTGMSGCWDWSVNSIGAYQRTVEACERVAGDLDAPFMECMARERIVPPGIILR